jgi:hypothetical protein
VRDPQTLVPGDLLASELVTLAADPSAIQPLASFSTQPVVLSWPLGDGTLIFSGALDAWRFRGDPKSQFTRFWRETILNAALAAPPRIAVDVVPAVVRPGEEARITVRLRRTEYSYGSSGDIRLPPVAARTIEDDGGTNMIRLWPASEPGVFDGIVRASRIGPLNVQASTGAGSATDTTLIVAGDAPELTGGVSGSAANLEPLIRHLSALPRPARTTAVHPMRSAWWMVPFVGALAVEWTVRRKRGLR